MDEQQGLWPAAPLAVEAPASSHDTGERDPLDRYYTPSWCALALIERVPELARPGARCVEPFAGRPLQLARALQAAGHSVHTCDLDASAPVDWQGDAIGRDWTGHTYDAVVTNPPFSLALEAARSQLHLAPLVAYLLRLSWLEPTEDRGEWLAAHWPDQMIILPRPKYLGAGGGVTSDSVTSAWLIWRATPVFCGRASLVTRAERDRLMLAAHNLGLK